MRDPLRDALRRTSKGITDPDDESGKTAIEKTCEEADKRVREVRRLAEQQLREERK